MLKGAMAWFLVQPAATKTDCTAHQKTFKERYLPQEINRLKQALQVWPMKQGKDQSAVHFMSAIEVEAGRAGITGVKLRCVKSAMFFPHIRQFVVTRECTDVSSLRKWLAIADAAADPKDHISSAMKDIQRQLEEMRVHAAHPSGDSGRGMSQSSRRVQFSVPSRSPSALRYESGCSRSASADRGWRSSESYRSRTSNRGYDQPQQSDDRPANASSDRISRACYVFRLHGHCAREFRDRGQMFRRGSGDGRQGFGPEQRYQRYGSFFRRAEVRSAVQSGVRSTGQTTAKGRLPIPCHQSGGWRSHSFNDCLTASAVCFNFGRVGHLSAACRQDQSTQ